MAEHQDPALPPGVFGPAVGPMVLLTTFQAPTSKAHGIIAVSGCCARPHQVESLRDTLHQQLAEQEVLLRRLEDARQTIRCLTGPGNLLFLQNHFLR